MPADEHIIFFYKNESFKNKILSAFFEPAAINHKKAQGLISIKRNTKFNVDSNVLYDELFLQSEKSAAVKKIYDWVYSLPLSNKLKKEEGGEQQKGGAEGIIIRIATDDYTWVFQKWS